MLAGKNWVFGTQKYLIYPEKKHENTPLWIQVPPEKIQLSPENSAPNSQSLIMGCVDLDEQMSG